MPSADPGSADPGPDPDPGGKTASAAKEKDVALALALAAAAETISPGATRSGLTRPSAVGPKLEKAAMWSTRRGETSARRNETNAASADAFRDAPSLSREPAEEEAAAAARVRASAARSFRPVESGADAAAMGNGGAPPSAPITKKPPTRSFATIAATAPASRARRIFSEKGHPPRDTNAAAPTYEDGPPRGKRLEFDPEEAFASSLARLISGAHASGGSASTSGIGPGGIARGPDDARNTLARPSVFFARDASRLSPRTPSPPRTPRLGSVTRSTVTIISNVSAAARRASSSRSKTPGPDHPKLAPTERAFFAVPGLVTVLTPPPPPGGKKKGEKSPKFPAAKIGRKSGRACAYASTSAASASYAGTSLPQLSLCTRAPARYAAP